LTEDGPERADEIKLKHRELLHELEQLDRKQTNWAQGLWTLVISLLLFVSLGLFNSPAQDILLLIGVLFFHECGHALGMTIFAYRNPRMFFLPFFGAAVTAEKRTCESWKEGLVLLLGPSPGILSGLCLGLLFHIGYQPWLYKVAWYFIVINAFNLLPFAPFDGGQLIRKVIFSRHPLLEAAFIFITAASLAAFSVWGEMWLLLVFSGLVLFSIPHSYRINALAREWRQTKPAFFGRSLLELEAADFQSLVEQSAVKFPALQGPRFIAQTLDEVWNRSQEKAPSWRASSTLLVSYALCCVLSGMAIAALIQFPLPYDKQSLWQNHLNQGVSLLQEQAPDEARNNFQSALEIRKPYRDSDRSYAENLYHLAHAQLQLGEAPKARENLKRARELLLIENPRSHFVKDIGDSLEALQRNPYNRDTTLSIWQRHLR
jgi:Zn-dependent protease